MIMKTHTRGQYLKHVLLVGSVCLFVSLGWPSAVGAIQPGADPQTTEPATGSVPPNPEDQRPERPIDASQVDTRAIVQQPQPGMTLQRRYADNYLQKSVWKVTDPQDGLRKDGRVAVLETLNSQVVYQFSPGSQIVNDPNQPDLTVYTHNKTGFDGPYNVFVANFGETTWTQLGANVVGTLSFDLPPNLPTVELVLITNAHDGVTYIEAVEGLAFGSSVTTGAFTYFPEILVGLRSELLDCGELERARTTLTNSGMGYQLPPLGEIEVKWNAPIKNEWKQEEFHIEANGDYEIYASDSRSMENFIGRRAGPQNIDLPQNMREVVRVRIRNHNDNRPVLIYAIAGRRGNQ